ncbi:gluconate 5-dehydrogenase [Yersinia enterocolitica]
MDVLTASLRSACSHSSGHFVNNFKGHQIGVLFVFS